MTHEVWQSVSIRCLEIDDVPPDDIIPPGAKMPCIFSTDGQVSFSGRVFPLTEQTLEDHHLKTLRTSGWYGHSSFEVTMDGVIIGAIEVHRDGSHFTRSSVG